MSDPLDLRFVFVAGKGGVGKSVVSAALALAAARRGKRVLLALCNAKERISHLLETEPLSPRIQGLLPNVDAVNMEPGAALEEYGMMVLKMRALYKLIFENRLVSAFLRGTPGIDAWAMLGKAQFHAFEKDQSGNNRYDLVILDAPATGHGLDLLRVPRVILDVVPPGLLRGEAERAWGLFTDPERSGVFLVTLPEELPTNETLELYGKLTGELGLSVCALAINRLLPRLFSEEDARLLGELKRAGSLDESLSGMTRTSLARAERELDQARCVARLRDGIPVPQCHLPALLSLDLRRKQLETLSRAFD